MKTAIRVVIADDHPLVRKGLRLTMEEVSEDFVLVGEADDGASALRLVEELQPDVVLMDVRMPGMDGLEALEHIHAKWPQIAVIILTTYNEDALVRRGLQAGACGYLLKDCDLEVLLFAIRAAAQGQLLMQPGLIQRILTTPQEETECLAPLSDRAQSQLTARELSVLAAVASGKRNKEIARQLSVSERTIWAHLTTIFNKLGVDSRTSAVAVALERGILPLRAEP